MDLSPSRLLSHIPAGILLPALVVLLAAFGFGWALKPDPPPEVRYRDVIVPESVLVASEPDTVVRWRERIVWRTVRAEVQATAPGAGLPDAVSFCDAAAAARAPEVAPGDTTGPPVPARLLLRSLAYDGRELQVWGPRSDGDLWSGSYRVGAPFRARVMGDSLFVQGDRWSGWRRWGERALWAGGGAALGYLAGELRD